VKPPAWLRRPWLRLEESLLVRLVASFTLLALGTLALAAGAAFFNVRATLRTTFLDRLKTVAFVKEGELNHWIDEEKDDLVFLASRLAVPRAGHPADVGSVNALFDAALGGALDMDEVFLLSAVGGRVIASTDRRHIGSYHVADLFFVHGRARTYVQNVYTSPENGKPTITIATPVRDARGTTVAVLAGHLNLDHIDQIVAERTGLGRTGEAYLVTPLNDFVSASRFGRPEVKRGVHSAGVTRALAGENGGGLYDNYAGAPVLGAWRWIAPRSLAIMVEMHADEAFAPARSLLLTMLLIGFATTGVAIAGVYLLARRIAQPILAVAHTASDVASGRFGAVAPVGTRDEVGVLARAFNDMTSRLNGMVGDLNRQVEETSRANRALEENQQLLQAVVDNTANLIVVLDQDARFLLVNRRFEDLFRRRHAEVRGLTLAAVLPDEAATLLTDAVHAAMAGQPVVERDASIARDGAIHHYHFVAFPLAAPERTPLGVGIIGVDLSERTRAEEERRRLEAGVQQAQKLESLGLLAGGVAHDFNNILTAVIGGTAIALEELGPASPVRADLEQVVASAERAAKLTRQMLAYAGRASFAIELFDLNDVIREMAELIAVSVPKQVRLQHELAADIPFVRADRTQISQIVLNLITNAAEATSRGGSVVLYTGIRQRADVSLADYRFVPSDAPAYVELVVEDDGAGMSAETLDKVFDPFFSTKGSGRGLGLAAVLGIVKQSGGTIRVASTPRVGTRFTVLFPAAAGRPAPAPAEPAPRGADAGSGVILLVDDEDVLRRATRKVLERAGYEVLEAVDGWEAVEMFEAEGHSLTAVILDVTMPVMGGAEAFRQMRAMGPLVPVIVSSGYDQQDTVRSFTGPEVEFLQKPYRPVQLLDLLRRLTTV